MRNAIPAVPRLQQTSVIYGSEEIADMVQFVKGIKRDVVVFVDNCYGEFGGDGGANGARSRHYGRFPD